MEVELEDVAVSGADFVPIAVPAPPPGPLKIQSSSVLENLDNLMLFSLPYKARRWARFLGDSHLHLDTDEPSDHHS